VRARGQGVYTLTGSNAESVDPVFEDYLRSFKALEETTEKFLKDVRVFSEAVIGARRSPRRRAGR
jgi:hypothetical protein